MAGTPTLGIAALSPLGFVKQTGGFGTGASSVPADGFNWVNLISNSLAYDVGEHLLQVGAGSRGAERFGARGQSMVKGAIEWFLQCEQSSALLGYFFGQDSCAGSSPTSATTVASGGAAGASTVVLTSGTGYTAGLFFQVTHAATGIVETHKIASLSTNTVTLNGSETFTYACTAGDATAVVTAPFTHTLSFAANPVLMTIEDYMSTGQAYLLQDAYSDQLDITSSKTDYKAKATILGGYNTTFASSAIAGDVATFSGDVTPLEWGDTSALTLPGSVTAAEADSFSFTLKNNIQQFFGAGQYTPTKAAGGIVTAQLKFTTLFDSAAAATAYANYVAGTESTIAATIGPVTANGQSGSQQVWTFPNSRVTAYPKKYALGSLYMVDTTAGVRIATGITAALTSKEHRLYC